MFEFSEVTSDVLEATPARVAQFLRAVATRAEIRSVLFASGYTEEEQEHAWQLLMATTEQTQPRAKQESDLKARAALEYLARWDGSMFRRIHAALGRLHPEQDAFVLAQIDKEGAKGAEVAIETVLNRLDALQSSPARAATREADLAALRTLTARGMDAAFFQNLRESVALARVAKTPQPLPERPEADKRDAALRELHAWYKDWSETARAVISRRDHRNFLGLSKRRRAQRKAEPRPVSVSVTSEEPTPLPPAPSSTPRLPAKN